MDQRIEVELKCDCFRRFFSLKKVKQCEWVWSENKSCPEVPEDLRVISISNLKYDTLFQIRYRVTTSDSEKTTLEKMLLFMSMASL